MCSFDIYEKLYTKSCSLKQLEKPILFVWGVEKNVLELRISHLYTCVFHLTYYISLLELQVYATMSPIVHIVNVESSGTESHANITV